SLRPTTDEIIREVNREFEQAYQRLVVEGALRDRPAEISPGSTSWWDRVRIRMGFQEGGILAGAGGPDSIPAFLAPGEAIVPYRVWSQGPDALADWFRAMGAPGFQWGGVVGPVSLFEGGGRISEITLIQRLIAQLRAADVGPDWEQRIESVISILEFLGHAAEMGGRALEETTRFLREIDQALREGPEALLELADAGDELAKRLLG